MTCFLRSTHALMPGRMGAWEALHAFAEGRQSDPWNGWSELVGIRLASVKTSALCAYGAAAIFLILFVAFPGGSPAAVYRVPEIAAHLLLFPVVAALPAASWARAAGYGWLLISVVAGVTTLHNPDVGGELLRLGGAAVAAMWIASASLAARSVLTIAGFPLVLLLLTSALVVARLPAVVYLLTFLLLLIWLALAGRVLQSAE